jgi:tetratricopeptide (TPR) repeat protein
MVEVTEEPPEAAPAPPARSKLPLLLGAVVLVSVAVGAGVVLGGKKDAPPPAPAPVAVPLPTPTSISSASSTTAHPERRAEGPESRETATPTPTPKRAPDRSRARTLLARGDAARGQADLDGAIQAYLAAEAADPSLAELQKKLALCYQQQGKDKEAAARYRRYLATNPPDAAKVRTILTTLQ